MNKISLCTIHTEQPFYIREINKNIYSIEELGYYLYNYLYLIDDGFFGEKLINYIENELGQTTIASGLKQIAANRGELGEKISFVIKNCGYYTERESEKLENHLASLSSKTTAERVKAKADILMENEKFNMAINYYNSILSKAVNNELPEEFYGNVYNNLGVAYARLFEYDDAVVAFRMAYRLNEAFETLEEIIMCDLIMGNEEKLKMDKDKYNVSDAVVTRLRGELEDMRKDVELHWDTDKEVDYIKKCKKKYIVEVNS
ncbi:MAG: tetratricopeptide repeat protein [Eubacterium sp.]|nr:tetratricopeptide repeat protein [Eubacterium sp.]